MTTMHAVRHAFELLTARPDDVPETVLGARPEMLLSRPSEAVADTAAIEEQASGGARHVLLRPPTSRPLRAEPRRVADDLERWWQILDQPNVVGAGVGFRIKDQHVTDEPALLVFVEQRIPRPELRGDQVIEASLPPSITGGAAVGVQVYELGQVVPQAFATRRRIQSGNSIGNPVSGDTGTLGAIVRRRGRHYLLSNSHVLGRCGRGADGEPIIYPGPADEGHNPKDVIGSLAECIPFSPSPRDRPRHVNEVDAALAEIHEQQLSRIDRTIRGLGYATGRRAPRNGMSVVLSGRTSGVARGTVISYPAQVRIQYEGVGWVGFSGQAICTRYTRPGDSGALVLESRTMKAVGLHFGGSSTGSVFTPISTVLRRLDCRLVLK